MFAGEREYIEEDGNRQATNDLCISSPFLLNGVGMTGCVTIFPSQIQGFIIAHEFTVVLGNEEISTVDKQRLAIYIERREHARNIGNFDVFRLKRDLQRKTKCYTLKTLKQS